MHTELVDRKRWMGEQRFLHALNYCMLLPGPEATQLAIYCGWLLHRTWGGIVAGVLFVLPSAVILWSLSVVYVTWGRLPWITAIFYGLKPAVTAIVAAAVVRLGRRALRNAAMWAVAGLAFGAIFVLHVAFPVIVGAAALAGLALRRTRWFPAAAEADPAGATVISDAHVAPEHARPSLARAVRVAGLSAALWGLPLLVLGCWQGWGGTLVREGVFFSKAAMVTFGGAYAVLPYVGQQAVAHYGWLSGPQMLDGLGLAETTPGPLIMVVQFVGFLGGWNHPGALSPLLAGTLGALITTWTTFVPCFLWIFLGAPHIEQLRGNAQVNAALSAVTAAVVGVVLNLALWFGWQVLVPAGQRVDWLALAITTAAFVALHRFKAEVVTVVLAAGFVGLAVWWLQPGLLPR
jgi:chromate transporter